MLVYNNMHQELAAEVKTSLNVEGKTLLDIARDRLFVLAATWMRDELPISGEQVNIPILNFRLPGDYMAHPDLRRFRIRNDEDAHTFILLNLLSDERLQIYDPNGQKISYETLLKKIKNYASIYEAFCAVCEEGFTAAISTTELRKIQEELKKHDEEYDRGLASLFKVSE